GGKGDGVAGLAPVPDLSGLLDDALPEAPKVPEVPKVPDIREDGGVPKQSEDLLDFLMGDG
nr:hypothetical protein [Actinomycetota bacterium]